MTSLTPRGPYTQEELAHLYPKNLKLQLVQILLRHGERTPVSIRFRNAGLVPYWPYCNAAKRISSVAMTKNDCSTWNNLQWRRRLESFGENDASILELGPNGEVDAICGLGELTDKGRETTLTLGQRLRHLYVDQLKYMPKIIGDTDMIYLRASQSPRALESVQQSFWGMYPLYARTASFCPPAIVTRVPEDETLYPNKNYCQRFGQLSRAFAQRTANKWNETEEMKYLTSLISKWMPEESKRVAVDSHPSLTGIMDTINSTLAHGPQTRLPSKFYDPKGQEIIDKIAVEEWFVGYKESREYREVGIGSLIGDIVARMVNNAERGNDRLLDVRGDDSNLAIDDRERHIRFAMSGCHDSTLAAILSSLGAFEGEKWPPYTSHLAIELFRDEETTGTATTSNAIFHEPTIISSSLKQSLSRGSFILSSFRKRNQVSEGISRKPFGQLTKEEKEKLKGLYVRLRYNDRPMIIPGCNPPGSHLAGDPSFCTLEAFKSIADKFTPRSWKQSCASNLETSAFPPEQEPAGY